jgi:quercetin dioxygenase-like cupin family protein
LVSGYTVARIEEIEEVSDGRAPMRPVRLRLGIKAFGVNSWTAAQAGDRIINEHDENEPGGHEELYVVTEGRAEFELDGEKLDAPAGTLVFVEPGLTRTAFAREAGTTILALGGEAGKPYRPDGWELWAPIVPLYQAGRYAEAADRAAVVVEQHPEHGGLFYNLACCESLAGRPDDAIAHLRVAIAHDEQFRAYAKKDTDLDPLRDEPGFQQLVG